MFQNKFALIICAFTAVFTGTIAAKDYRNKTIDCVFKQYNECYKTIGSLGANFSARYDETTAEINATCNSSRTVTERCLSDITTSCNTRLDSSIGLSVNSLIGSLCNNKSKEQARFLNSSACYNKNQKRRIDCVTSYSPGSNTDARSLCCSLQKQQECLRDNMTLVCTHNATDFQNHLVNEYRKVHFILCGTYFKYCNSAPILGGYLLTIIVVIAITLL
ncbi:uncharacterized protein [Parasteatoda tepidariorum]|uniref:uncharacterized protein n=1 Tax=Parasteatoda tepidariorum TaxID=114398 RepID=UPI00077FD021|nr:uncharacterized protein LOC107457094 [Parasteatoda tepidariorum]